MSNIVEPQHYPSPYDDASGLAMLPKMKPLKEQSDGNSDVPDNYEDYYSVEFAEPQMDDVDVELLERFLRMLDATPRSNSDVNYDDLLLKPDDSEQTQNNSSGDESTPEKKTEMTSAAHERDRRSADDNVVMTAEHMTAAGDAAKVNRPSRLKRDLNDYLYRRRWNSLAAEDYESPLAENKFEDNSIDPESYAEDYNEDNPLSEAQLRRYLQLQRAFDELKERTVPAYLPVVYRGVRGIFLPETSVARKYGGLYQAAADWHRSLPASSVSTEDAESAADKWSLLVREEVKKALDEYDLVYRLADALKTREI